MPSPQKIKTCKYCPNQVHPWSSQSSLNRFCSHLCAAKWSQMKRDERRLKVHRKQIAQRRESIKPKSEVLKDAQKQFNRYIRERDFGKPCVSCGSSPGERFGGSIDAGHYRGTGRAPHLRFHLLNCHAQCKQCNRDFGGSPHEYRAELIRRYGRDYVERLDADYRPRKYSIDQLRRIKTIFSRRANLYAKLRRKRSEGS